jgi:predicted  nucleic acid-binding Zn-ribbon protein
MENVIEQLVEIAKIKVTELTQTNNQLKTNVEGLIDVIKGASLHNDYQTIIDLTHELNKVANQILNNQNEISYINKQIAKHSK